MANIKTVLIIYFIIIIIWKWLFFKPIMSLSLITIICNKKVKGKLRGKYKYRKENT